MPPRHLNFLLITISLCFVCHTTHRRTRSAILIGDAINLLDAQYVDPVDREELVRSAMAGLTTGLDQHTEFISQRDYETFQDNIQQEFAGIGIFVEQPDPKKPVRVVSPLVGSPALQAGMLPGDLIVGVNNENVAKMKLEDVSNRLRGPVGSSVLIKVERSGPPVEMQSVETKSVELQNIEMQIKRANIQLESIVGDYRDEKHKWVFRLKEKPEIAYIRMSSFGEKTLEELKSAITSLGNDYAALVLDLRGNGGGLLNAAAEIADLFLDSGAIVSTRTRGGIIQDQFTATSGVRVPLSKPMAILIDGNSASASEILAAALQDHGRAVIVGTRSYGKGTVQNIVPLQYGRSAMRLTVARYYRPSGVNIHRLQDAKEEDTWGVRPDEGCEMKLEAEQLEKIGKRWRRASLPALAQALNPEENTTDGEISGLMIDLQLKLAVEKLLGEEPTESLPDSEKNAGSLPAAA